MAVARGEDRFGFPRMAALQRTNPTNHAQRVDPWNGVWSGIFEDNMRRLPWNMGTDDTGSSRVGACLWLRSAVFHVSLLLGLNEGRKEGSIRCAWIHRSRMHPPPPPPPRIEKHTDTHYHSPTRGRAPGKGGTSWILRIVVDPLVHNNLQCGFHVALFFWTFDNGPMWMIHFDNPWRCWAKQSCGCNSRTRRRRGRVVGFVLRRTWG